MPRPSQTKYYEQHKEEINARRREYNRTYAKKYYETHKEEINAKRKVQHPKKSGRPPKPSIQNESP